MKKSIEKEYKRLSLLDRREVDRLVAEELRLLEIEARLLALEGDE